MILLSTIWQTGTNYMMQELGRGRYVQKHCTPDILQELDPYDRVITTYRHPLYVARSWSQRYEWPEVEQDWMEQWATWRGLIEAGAEVANVADFTGPAVKRTPHGRIYHDLTSAIAKGDMAEIYRHVPKRLIDFAMLQLPEGYDD